MRLYGTRETTKTVERCWLCHGEPVLGLLTIGPHRIAPEWRRLFDDSGYFPGLCEFALKATLIPKADFFTGDQLAREEPGVSQEGPNPRRRDYGYVR